MSQQQTSAEHPTFLSTKEPSHREARVALVAILVSAAFFFAVLPFAKQPLTPTIGFIASQQAALVVFSLITAALLYSQFNVVRARALLVLAGGYLFTALIAISHTLTFPGIFTPTGLLGAGPQSAAWLSLFMLGGFPLFVMLYAIVKARTGPGTVAPRPDKSRVGVLASLAIAVGAAAALTLLATVGRDALPEFAVSEYFSPLERNIVAAFGVLSLAALGLMWHRRPHTVLDLWLMVVLCAWIFDIGLGSYFNSGRFDVGFYASHIYGLAAASFLLVFLLIEHGSHYARLVQVSVDLGAANRGLEALSLHDWLTGLANRRYLDTYLGDQIAIAQRHKRTLALIMLDVDSFKAFNDAAGHQGGDECLKRIASALRRTCRRPADLVGRFGGEEFTLVLPDTEREGALYLAETARKAVLQLAIPHPDVDTQYITISGGLAMLPRGIPMSAHELIEAADSALFEAKDQGRNRVVVAPDRLPKATPEPAFSA